ncbi:Ribosomal RNA large subunit methyltransferase I [bacterium HR33]|nr:Ribosomal RNA large subunit methyltransferase I [bacterium HR33]
MTYTVTVSKKGALRWERGHPWIYRSDVGPARSPAGIVDVQDGRGRFLGRALYSPASEIRLRLLTREAEPIDRGFWERRLERAAALRAGLEAQASAYRLVHAEADSLPSLIVDRYGEYLVVQLLSAGLEAVREQVLEAICNVFQPRGVLLRNDAPVRRLERLPLEVVEAFGSVPEIIEVREGNVGYLVAPRTGQKTGAFLDQRENRELAGTLARGRALDLFTYQGLFALYLARNAQEVTAVDSSGPALELAKENARLNGIDRIEWVEADVFDFLPRLEREGRRFDCIVVDPPPFARQKTALRRALAGYKEINLRAMRLLTEGGVLLTFSCSFHVGKPEFLSMLGAAAADSGRRIALERLLGQPRDHPEMLTIPETGYLKGAVLRALD